MTERGDTAYLTGSFDAEDEAKFAAFLMQPRTRPLRILYLHSHGGVVQSAIAIGRMVRRAGLATAVLADRTVCDSACTFVFAGGVRRHYVHGERVHEGHSSMTGLGFHPARRRGDARNPSVLAYDGTAQVRAFYAEMGMPQAAELMDRAAINTVYRPSGRTALAYRIATSLSAP